MKQSYKFLLIICIGALFSVKIQCQELQAIFHHNSFLASDDKPFVETYLRIFGNSVNYTLNENEKYQAEIDVQILFIIDNELIYLNEYSLFSQELNDTTGIKEDFLDQQRINIPNGIYHIKLTISDKNTDLTPVIYNDSIRVEFDKQNVTFSSIQLIDRFEKSEQDNILTKSGYDLYPYVSDYYPSEIDKLSFYVELNNIDKIISPNSDFLITGFFEDQGTQKKIADYGFIQLDKADKIIAVLRSFDISMLSSGKYFLIIEARDNKNNLLASQKTALIRNNPSININLADIPTVDVSESYISGITNIDTLSFYLGSIRPIAGNMEKRFIDNQLKKKDVKTMQQFFYSFWKERNELFPDVEWKEYYRQVIRVEEAYETKIKHGFQTDRGRVYLQYGAPNDVERSVHSAQSYPYEIWHYFFAEGQSNLKFIFYHPNLVGTEYILVNSNALGEVNNPGWNRILNER